MTDHDGFLDALLTAFSNQVFLAGRYADERLALPKDDVLRVFLPDFHWMSTICLQRYTGGYQFNGNLPLPDGRPTFATLLGVLENVQAGGGFELFQLGDRFDLWREMTDADPDVLTAYRRVRDDAAVSGLASRLNDLGARYIRGNHDAWLAEVEPQIQEPVSFKELPAAKNNILLTHGHRYDNVEMLLPDKLKAVFVGLAPKIRPGTYAVGPFSNKNAGKIVKFLAIRKRANNPMLFPNVVPDGARFIQSRADVDAIATDSVTYLDAARFSHGTGNRNDFEHISYLTFGDKVLTFEQNHPEDHAVHVIGHTHHARILVDRLPSGRPHVTLDCGGWIENCTVRLKATGSSHVAPSAQIGVQHGNDLRIYQLGGNF